MSFVAREVEALDAAYREAPEDDPHRAALHAARQALGWALEPTGFMSPLKSIKRGSQEDSGDCRALSRPPSF
jgi:hypothetical protein